MRAKALIVLLVLLSASILLFGCTLTNPNNNPNNNVPNSPVFPEDDGASNNANAGSVPSPPALPE